LTRAADRDTPAAVPQLSASRLAPLLLLASLAGCALPGFLSYPPQVRGIHVDADQLKQLVPGTSTRNDVVALIGSPTTKATFDDNTWLYIGEVTKPVIAGTQAVLDQQVVVLTFDDKGVLRGITRKTADDGLPVSMASGATPSPGSDATVMQQLLGNIGRFNPVGAAGGNAGPSGVNTTPGY
jgi:outer membrane protein assembly factor BamE (lipoprotein component of BamABCDE complex)